MLNVLGDVEHQNSLLYDSTPLAARGRSRRNPEGQAKSPVPQRRISSLQSWWDRSSGTHSISAGLLNKTVSLIDPCPTCGKPELVGTPGSRVEAVSSGGKRTREFKKAITSARCSGSAVANALRAVWASPPCRKITSFRLTLRPSCP